MNQLNKIQFISDRRGLQSLRRPFFALAAETSAPGGRRIPLCVRGGYAWGGCSRSSRRSPAMSVTGRENTRDWASVCIPA